MRDLDVHSVHPTELHATAHWGHYLDYYIVLLAPQTCLNDFVWFSKELDFYSIIILCYAIKIWLHHLNGNIYSAKQCSI